MKLLPDKEVKPMQAVKNEIQTYIDIMFELDDIIEFRSIKKNRKSKCQWVRASDALSILNGLKEDNRSSLNIYVGANPRCDFDKHGDENIPLARTVFVDFDGLGDDCERIVSKRIQTAGLPEPSWTIHSGHGIHCYWKLHTPVEDMDYWRWIQKGLIDTLDSDKRIHNPERIMRLPGFRNTKETPYVETRFIDVNPDRIYYIGDIEAILGQSEPLLDEPETLQKKPDIDSTLTPEIMATVPVKKDTRRDCTFKFARILKSKHKTADPKWFFPLHDEWLKKAEPNINHKDKGLNRTQFVKAFHDVKYLIGDSPMSRIFEHAKTLDFPEELLADYENPKLVTLAKVCKALQDENPNRPFFLKQETIGQLMGITQQYISDLLSVLVSEKIIKVVSEYRRPTTKTQGKTKTYKYLI